MCLSVAPLSPTLASSFLPALSKNSLILEPTLEGPFPVNIPIFFPVPLALKVCHPLGSTHVQDVFLDQLDKDALGFCTCKMSQKAVHRHALQVSLGTVAWKQ